MNVLLIELAFVYVDGISSGCLLNLIRNFLNVLFAFNPKNSVGISVYDQCSVISTIRLPHEIN